MMNRYAVELYEVDFSTGKERMIMFAVFDNEEEANQVYEPLAEQFAMTDEEAEAVFYSGNPKSYYLFLADYGDEDSIQPVLLDECQIRETDLKAVAQSLKRHLQILSENVTS